MIDCPFNEKAKQKSNDDLLVQHYQLRVLTEFFESSIKKYRKEMIVIRKELNKRGLGICKRKLSE